MKIKIETKDNRLIKEKDYDLCADYKEFDFWTLYCKLYSATQIEISIPTISMLAHILTHEPNRSMFADYSDKELSRKLSMSRTQRFKLRTELISKGILINEDIPNEYLLNRQFTALQIKVKQLVKENNLKSIQLNFNCSIQ